MMRAFLITAALVALGGCGGNAGGDESNGGRAWYESGDATYDDLKRANEACKASGGEFQLKKGGDPTHLGDYACIKDKAH
jgi:hypothetical protein